MDSFTQNFSKKHIAQIVQVVSEILGGQTSILQRIEQGYEKQNQLWHEMINKLELLDKKIQGGFTVLETNRITSLDKNVTQKISTLEYGYLKQLKQQLDSLHTKLQQQVHAQFFQLLIKKGQSLPATPEVAAPVIAPPLRVPSRIKPAAVISPTPTTTPAAPLPVVEDIKGDIMDSEVEGAEVYETIITSWKRRDWEKFKDGGTKEEFVRAWRKLSNTDRQKIKNGAWSEPIMNKMKMLGRE
jgi:hypothetical protein